MNLPPYGLMPASWGNEDLAMPAAFKRASGTPATPQDWTAWLESMADEMAEFLWPRWSGGAWQGAAASTMSTLTLADMTVMASLTGLLARPAAPSGVLHETLFMTEDPRPPSLAGFLHYFPGAPDALVQGFDGWLLAGGGDNGRPVSLNLKRRMQRPRPYQAHLILSANGTALAYRAASSATSPSLVSGHCIQGCLALINVVDKYEDRRKPTDAALLDRICQYFIDTGDRRVYAGVHYPTDNLASWFVSLRLCRHFYRGKKAARAREVLWSAIQASTVYLAMVDAVRKDKKSPFAVPLDRLKTEAEKDFDTSRSSKPSARSQPR